MARYQLFRVRIDILFFDMHISLSQPKKFIFNCKKWQIYPCILHIIEYLEYYTFLTFLKCSNQMVFKEEQILLLKMNEGI
jgi:hypothetical protein